MDPRRPIQTVDVRLRATTVRFAVWITIAVCSISLVYAFATWDSPNRVLIVGLLVGAMATALAIGCLDAERIVRSRWRETFFVTWSIVDIAFLGAIVALDGGTRSPIALVYFVPLVFAALSYPLGAVVAISLIDVAVCVGVGALLAKPDWTYLAFFASTLGCTATLCVWHARNHDRQRGELAAVSRTDPLTESLNRRGFEERMDAELDETARHGRPLSLMLLDLDDFKGVNDTLGHAAGDDLLRWVVSTVKSTLRPFDDVGRLGGDEFAVLLPAAARRRRCRGRRAYPRGALRAHLGHGRHRRLPARRRRSRGAAPLRRRRALRHQARLEDAARASPGATSAGRPTSPTPSTAA